MSLKALWGNSDSERWTGNKERKIKNGERKIKNGERKIKNGERRTWNGEKGEPEPGTESTSAEIGSSERWEVRALQLSHVVFSVT